MNRFPSCRKCGLAVWLAASLIVSAEALTSAGEDGSAELELPGGPMVGHTTDRSVRIWARGNRPAEMVVSLSTHADLSEAVHSKPVRLKAEDDLAGVVELSGLTSATRYFYQVRLDGRPMLTPPLPSFRTFASEGQPTRVRVLFGGGIRFQVDPKQTIWDDMRAQDATAMLLMGDNIYPDNAIAADYLEAVLGRLDLGGTEKLLTRRKRAVVPHGDDILENVESYAGPSRRDFLFHRAYYRIQQALPTYRQFVSGVPTYAVWDDHDAYHDGQGGAHLPMEMRKQSLRAFRENFAQPYYGGGEEHPGTWCHFKLADVEFFLLDARTYRERGGDRERRFLGEEEERWLKERLLASQARVKFLVCGSPWNNQPKTGPRVLTDETYYAPTGDTLASYKWHRDQLLEWIIENRIANVVLLSGDRHRAEVVSVWPRSRPDCVFYDLSNCNIASRTQSCVGEPGENGLLYCFSGRCFGVLDIDTTAEPATVAYEIWGQHSRRLPFARQHRFVLRTTDFLPEPVR